MISKYLIRSLTLIACLLFVGATAQAATTLTSVKTDKPVLLSGTADKVWNKAAPLTVKLDNLPYEPSTGYDGMKETTVTMKSLYDDEYIYLLVQYDDPTESLARFPWVKQQDGTWKQLKKKAKPLHPSSNPRFPDPALEQLVSNQLVQSGF